MSKSFILFFFLVISTCVSAQGDPLFFQQINKDNGLSNDNVNCILQDSRGFTWIGTNDGLNRYDGKMFSIFRHQPQNKFSIGGNIITHIIEDSEGFLWIATADGGISRYDYRSSPDRQFLTYQYDPADKKTIPGNIINKLLMDDKGMLWIATSGRGIVRFNTKTGSFYQLPVSPASTVLDIEMAADGKIWAGVQGRGILKIDPLTTKVEADERYSDPYKKLPHVVVASIFKDSYDDIWIGSWDKKLYRYDNGNKSPQEILKNNTAILNNDDALCFEEDNKGLMWIGGKFNGLYILNRKDNSVLHYSNNPLQEGTIAHNKINCIYKDREGNIWLGTARGISLHRPLLQQFTQTFLPAINNEQVNKIYDFTEDEQQSLYIATDKGIFWQRKGEASFQFMPLVYNGERLQVSKFYWRNKELLVGTNMSLFVLDLLKKQLTPLPNTDKDIVMKRIIESRVVSIAADSIPGRSVLWTIPYGHYLAYYDFAAQQWVSRQDSVKKIVADLKLTDNLIRKIVVDRNGTRWIATAKEGLGMMRRNETAFTYFSSSNNKGAGLLATDVYDMLPDAEGNIWVSSHGGGLFYGTGQPLSFKHIAGSPNLGEGMQLDEKQNLWFISGNSLYKYRLAENKVIAWQLPDIEKSTGVRGYIFKSRNGYLYMPGNNYFIKFLPSAVYKKTTSPTIYITDLKVNAHCQTGRLFEKNNRFSYSNNSISLEFAAPKVPDDEPMQFEYRMKGLNDEWAVTDANVQNFANLQPGDYVFEARIAGATSEKDIVSFAFTIIPPFYRTWWFFIICALFIAAAAYGLYRYRINQLLKQQAMRNKIAQDLHDSVGSTLSSISVYSQVAKIYKQQEKQNELQDALEKISTTSGEMISEMNDIVWAINPRNDNMNIILQRMESYAKPLLQTKGISFNFNYDPAILLLNLKMEQRKNFYLIFKEAVNNALKYSNCNHLEVDVKVSGKFIELIVQDDGVGFDMEQLGAKTSKSLSGNGLNNMKRRATD
ncbi:MAG TPA: two-component regulator propeller domain-containing protein, partial [Chitinophagaceae bacterium]